MEAVKRLGLRPQCGHLDSTSFHVDGQYNSEHEAGVIHITQGYSRDYRPDLNQVVVQLIADNQAGIPLWMEPLSGNSSDKTSFRATVKAHVGQLKRDYQLDYLVADRALYTAETLPTLTELCWVTRVPETLKEARQAIGEAAPVLMESLDKLSYQHLESAYAGIRQRWVVVYSPEAYQRAIKRVDRHCLQQSTAELKAFEVLCRREFACRVDAEQALAEFKKTQTLTTVASSGIEEIPHYPGRGRPGKGQKPTFTYTTWKVSSFAGRQSLRLSGWHQHLQYFITGFALGQISLAYSGSHTDHIQNPTCLKKPLASLGERVCKA